MAKRKRVLYDFHEFYRLDKLDDMIFAYFTGVRSVMPTAKLTTIALNFQKDWGLNEDNLAMDIIIMSYHRTYDKHKKHIQVVDNQYFI